MLTILLLLVAAVDVRGQCDFRCANGQNAIFSRSPCLPKAKVCDGLAHCADESDERNCPVKCDSGFRCANGQNRIYSNSPCVPANMICDGLQHCADNSDESQCAGQPATRRTDDCFFRCANGQDRIYTSSPCVPRSMYCDGMVHCSDGSDEQACPQINVAPSDTCAMRCANGQNRIYTNSPCVPASMVCDGNGHCADGSDERGCPRTKVAPPDNCAMRCANGHNRIYTDSPCVPASMVCDGDGHCADGSDERGCPQIRVAPSDNCAMRCANGQNRIYTDSPCVPANMVCDGNGHCADGSDEANCGKAPVRQCERVSAPASVKDRCPGVLIQYNDAMLNGVQHTSVEANSLDSCKILCVSSSQCEAAAYMPNANACIMYERVPRGNSQALIDVPDNQIVYFTKASCLVWLFSAGNGC